MSIELMERALEFITGVYFGEHEGSRADREKLEADLTTAIQQAEAQQPATGEPVKGLLRDMQAIADGAIKIPAREFAMHALAEFGAHPAPSVPTVPASAYDRLQALCDDQARRLLELEDAPSVFLVRDVASLLGASVPDVCDALAELGYEPRRSTNAAISPDEAVAVAKRLNPAPSVPGDVARAAERYQYLLHHMGLVEAHARTWNPAKHKPLIQFMQDFIDAAKTGGAP